MTRVTAAWLGLLGSTLAACVGDPREPEVGSASEAVEDTDATETGEPEPALGDACEDTPWIVEAPTSIAASLRDASSDPFGVATDCGLTGPTVWVEASVHDRVDLFVGAVGRGFTPRFAVLRPGCIADPSRVLVCGEGLPVTIADIGPDAALLIGIGIDAEDVALTLPFESADADPLGFELQLEARAVLGELDVCGPSYGRCEPGTVCLTELEGPLEDPQSVARCRRPPADSCVNPGIVVVPNPGAAAVIEIAEGEPHSDAHEHTCNGWRRPERVERLVLPAGLDETATLMITADHPGVGLALRRADCLPEHELACAPATGAGVATSLGAPLDLGEAPLLFIELPEPPQTVHVSVEIVE